MKKILIALLVLLSYSSSISAQAPKARNANSNLWVDGKLKTLYYLSLGQNSLWVYLGNDGGVVVNAADVKEPTLDPTFRFNIINSCFSMLF